MSRDKTWCQEVIDKSTPQQISDTWIEDSIEVNEYVEKLQAERDELKKELIELKAKLPKIADGTESLGYKIREAAAREAGKDKK